MTKTKFSKHALKEREERIVWIATEVGFGQIIDTIQIYDRGLTLEGLRIIYEKNAK